MKKMIRVGLIAILGFCQSFGPAFLYAAEISGKIVQVRADKNTATLILDTGVDRPEVTVSNTVEVEGSIPAEKIKSGYKIYGNAAKKNAVRRGTHSPFKGIPKSMRKSMGLPDIPETPQVPDAKPDLPKVPKVPKGPKTNLKAQQNAEPPPANQGSGRPSRPEHEEVPIPQEVGNVFGKADEKALGPAEGAPEPVPTETITPGPKKVIRIKKSGDVLQVEVVNAEGQLELIALTPDSKVTRLYSVKELSKNMQVKVDAEENKGKLSARKISVLA